MLDESFENTFLQEVSFIFYGSKSPFQGLIMHIRTNGKGRKCETRCVKTFVCETKFHLLSNWHVTHSIFIACNSVCQVGFYLSNALPHSTQHGQEKKIIRISGKSVVLCRLFRNPNNRLFDILFGFQQRHLVHIYSLNNEHRREKCLQYGTN